MQVLEMDQLIGRFFVGDMDIRYGKEIQQPCFLSGAVAVVLLRHEIEPSVVGKPRAVGPIAVAVLFVFGNLPETDRSRRGRPRHDRPLNRCLHVGGDRVSFGLALTVHGAFRTPGKKEKQHTCEEDETHYFVRIQ